jgi:hypothetical protein
MDTEYSKIKTGTLVLNLNNVLAVKMYETYCLALTLSNGLYMWGHMGDCISDLDISFRFGQKNRKNCPFPTLIYQIKFNISWNFYDKKFSQIEDK